MRPSWRMYITCALLMAAGGLGGLAWGNAAPASPAVLMALSTLLGLAGVGAMFSSSRPPQTSADAALPERPVESLPTRAPEVLEALEVSEASKTSEEAPSLLDLMLEGLDIGLCVLDVEGRVKAINPSFERIFLAKGEAGLEGRLLTEFSEPVRVSILNELLRGALSDGEAQLEAMRRMFKARRVELNGERCVQIFCEPLVLRSSELERVVAINQELLDTNRTLTLNQQTLETQNAELRESEKFKSEFLANVSHDLRTPLVSIRGYAELLLRGHLGDINERQRHGLDTTLRNLDRLLAMIDNLLELSRTQKHGHQELKLEQFDLAEQVTDAVELFMPKAASAGIDLQVRFSDERGARDSLALPVLADRLKLHRICINLLSNALKFTPSGGKVRVYLRLANEQERTQILGNIGQAKIEELRSSGQWPISRLRGEWVLMKVLDTGCGIPPHELDNIFERWATTQGHGLGLAITDEYIRLHGGLVQVDSEVGVGTSFSVWMPVGEPRAVSGRVDSRSLRRSLQPRPAAQRPKVLVVDDEPDIREFTQSVLTSHDYDVVHVGTLDEMWDALDAHSPDAVLLDFYIDGVESTEALRRLKNDPRWSTTPVGVVSARTDGKVASASSSAGAIGCLPKPWGIDDLLEFVHRMLQPPLASSSAEVAEQERAG